MIRELPPIDSAPLPANYTAAVEALKQLDALTRKLAKGPMRPGELELWRDILKSHAQLLRDINRIQARAIRECGKLLKDWGGAA